MRSAAGRSCRERSSWTDDCRRAEAVEPELGGEPDDSRRSGAGLRCEVGDGTEGDEMRVLQHGLGDATLGHRELTTGGGDAVGDLQLSHTGTKASAGEYPPHGTNP